MKRIIPLITAVVAVAFASILPLRAQDNPNPTPEPAPPYPRAEGEAAITPQRAKAELQRAEAETAAAHPRMQDEKERVGGGGGGGGLGGGFSFTDRLRTIISRSPAQAGKPMIIRSSPMDPKEEAALEEDLSVMSHILDKALNERLGWHQPSTTAMGVNVFFAPGSTPMRSLYLEGYGALFLLNVSFPLVPPPAKEEQEKPSGDSAWEEAKQELYGQHSYGRSAGPAEEFSEEKVNKLKDALLESLKNAANIRDLKPEDSVTVSVFGGASGVPAHIRYKALAQSGSGTAGNTTVLAAPAPGGPPLRKSVLTIRIRKADADAFSKGKMNLDDFRKKARITAYTGNAEEDGLAASPFGQNWSGGGGFGSWGPTTVPPGMNGQPGGGGGAFGGQSAR
jgi:hypothetical protein